MKKHRLILKPSSLFKMMEKLVKEGVPFNVVPIQPDKIELTFKADFTTLVNLLHD